MKIEIGDKVILKSFHNKTTAPKDTSDDENYWKLIGLTGRVLKMRGFHPAYKDMGPQALVEFDDDLLKYRLNCHNDPPNTLWIFVSDMGL